MTSISTADPAQAAYESLAPYYDAFTADHDYRDWMGTLLGLAAEQGPLGSHALDVACGTGRSLQGLLSAGLAARGCDLSPAMLAQARAKLGPQADLTVADVLSLPQLGPVDLVTFLDDAVNYLLRPADLPVAFRALARQLRPGGLLVFDANTLRCYQQTFATDRAFEQQGRFFVWRGQSCAEFAPEQTAEATIEVFCAEPDGGWSRISSRHLQRHHPLPALRQALASSGFQIRAVRGQTPDGALHRHPDEARHTKTIFVAQRDVSSAPREEVM